MLRSRDRVDGAIVAPARPSSARVAISMGVVVENAATTRSEEHTSELQSQSNLVCRLLLEKKKIDETHSKTILQHRLEHENHPGSVATYCRLKTRHADALAAHSYVFLT